MDFYRGTAEAHDFISHEHQCQIESLKKRHEQELWELKERQASKLQHSLKMFKAPVQLDDSQSSILEQYDASRTKVIADLQARGFQYENLETLVNRDKCAIENRLHIQIFGVNYSFIGFAMRWLTHFQTLSPVLKARFLVYVSSETTQRIDHLQLIEKHILAEWMGIEQHNVPPFLIALIHEFMRHELNGTLPYTWKMYLDGKLLFA